MDTLTTLKTLHWLATALLLGSVAAVLWRAQASWRAGDHRLFASTLDRPWWVAWAVMAVALASFPISGWWLVHSVGWPLSQAWLLAGSVLYIVGALAWLALLLKVRRLRASAPANAAVLSTQGRWVMAVAGLAVVILLVLMVLMLAKPA
ncbi:DUF2269 family protein [Pseudomonas sp. NPDC007930]|uniref:DUF2269 family protein n=1 Tax=Pseudomonas sp. NPDC007930 TaxID=3364417 RepID=UPI0036E50D31